MVRLHPKLTPAHVNAEGTARVVIPYAIKALQDKGYKLVTVAECLGVEAYKHVSAPQPVSLAYHSSVLGISYHLPPGLMGMLIKKSIRPGSTKVGTNVYAVSSSYQHLRFIYLLGIMLYFYRVVTYLISVPLVPARSDSIDFEG
jgi:hypothetical protein